MELQITYETLFRHIPGLRLAVDFSELHFKRLSNFHGLYEMPVTW
jgi:cytochrome P450